MKLLTKEQHESNKNGKNCYIFQDKFEDKHAKYKNIVMLGAVLIINWDIDVLCNLCNLCNLW